ncbi:PadR family transcriptional regulator [Anaerovorax odorimutans]|uniref:PadR family transcriptional regulator n=1 Tax=Anaerovorax odorimutans TaxID=109327 RepID=UPI00040B6935|nr:helix-turn-helix transcriptional regulator [Anaerovorax odorimutans]
MKLDKSLNSGNTTMLILKLIEEEDMYGYQMIESLEKKSNSVFSLKAGTLYPILHSLEQQNMVTAYEGISDEGRKRKYYKITEKGKKLLQEKEKEWVHYANAVKNVLGGVSYVGA